MAATDQQFYEYSYNAIYKKNWRDVCFRLCEIRWVYLIKGVTETAAVKDLAPAVIQTKARQQTEMRLEVMLSNSVAGSMPQSQLMRCQPVEHDVSDYESQQIIVGEGRYGGMFTLQVLTFLSDCRNGSAYFLCDAKTSHRSCCSNFLCCCTGTMISIYLYKLLH